MINEINNDGVIVLRISSGAAGMTAQDVLNTMKALSNVDEVFGISLKSSKIKLSDISIQKIEQGSVKILFKTFIRLGETLKNMTTTQSVILGFCFISAVAAAVFYGHTTEINIGGDVNMNSGSIDNSINAAKEKLISKNPDQKEAIIEIAENVKASVANDKTKFLKALEVGVGLSHAHNGNPSSVELECEGLKMEALTREESEFIPKTYKAPKLDYPEIKEQPVNYDFSIVKADFKLNKFTAKLIGENIPTAKELNLIINDVELIKSIKAKDWNKPIEGLITLVKSRKNDQTDATYDRAELISLVE